MHKLFHNLFLFRFNTLFVYCKNKVYARLFTGGFTILYPIAATAILIKGLIMLKKQ